MTAVKCYNSEYLVRERWPAARSSMMRGNSPVCQTYRQIHAALWTYADGTTKEGDSTYSYHFSRWFLDEIRFIKKTCVNNLQVKLKVLFYNEKACNSQWEVITELMI